MMDKKKETFKSQDQIFGELKQCPFCGSKDIIIKTWKNCYLIGCKTDGCFCEITPPKLMANYLGDRPPENFVNRMIVAWNKRQ